jgi:hypothetical protein
MSTRCLDGDLGQDLAVWAKRPGHEEPLYIGRPRWCTKTSKVKESGLVNGDRDGGAPSVVKVAVVYLHINRDVSRNGKTGANKFS